VASAQLLPGGFTRDDRFRDHPPGSRLLDRGRDLNGEAPAGRQEDRAVRLAFSGWTGAEVDRASSA